MGIIQEALNHVQAAVAAHPFLSIGSGILLGLISGLLIRRKKKEK